MFAELDRLHEALRIYINANYHLSHPALVQLRDELLQGSGALQQRPFVESTPRYIGDKTYRELGWLPSAVRELFCLLADGKIIFKSPYTHQAQALQHVLLEGRDLVVTTGTGSGKTETFLLPVLGRLAQEAATSPHTFRTRAVRALVLYPMNALVNDQLGRMRGIFGSPLVADWFRERTGRPMKFARYTGKTLYAGRRRPGGKHGERLQQLRLYTKLEEQAQNTDPDVRREARELIHALKKIGKWPSKPDSAPDAYDGMTRWYGKDGSSWAKRTYEDLSLDPELLIRHEVQASPPDILITNYSMLEYTLLRPIERDIFRKTAEFFAENPQERFILVLDESHLYRGAAGAEIGMLVRRLRSRLGLSADQLQIISTSASFSSAERAKEFVAGLSGKPISGFEVLSGDKVVQDPDGPGDHTLAESLRQISLEAVYSGTLAERAAALAPLRTGATLHPCPVQVSCEGAEPFTVLVRGIDEAGQAREVRIEAPQGRGISDERLIAVDDARLVEGRSGLSIEVGFAGEPALATLGETLRYPPGRDPLCRMLWDLLAERPVVGRLVNQTSGVAQDLQVLPGVLFPDVEAALAKEATSRLLELCPMARSREDDRPLLAARVHVFLRGLPGLWACTDPDCTALPEDRRGIGPTGQIYAQPIRRCGCGARVFELFSCRSCGVAYLNAWTDDPDQPTYLWLDDIGQIEGQRQVEPLSILLPSPDDSTVLGARPAQLELTTGKLFLHHPPSAERVRDVWLPTSGDSWKATGIERRGWFSSCPCCGGAGSRYPIQDHTTSGDDPFMEVVREQLVIQPPRPDSKTPLKGRKVLVFSDGRQLASRLAGKLQESALRDSGRPLLLEGLRLLEEACERQIPLAWAYLAVLVACVQHGVEPRPKQAPWIVEDLERVSEELFDKGALRHDRWEETRELADKLNAERGNIALMSVLLPVIDDPYTGLAALGLADITPIWRDSDHAALKQLPAPRLGIFAKLTDDEARYALVQLWLQLMLDRRALLLPTSPQDWRDTDDGPRVSSQKGSFQTPLKELLTSKFHMDNLSQTSAGVKKPWLRFLYDRFGINETGKGFLLNPARITLKTEGNSWGRCERCSAVQPLISGTTRSCIKRWGGKKTCSGTLVEIDPAAEPHSDAERIFRSRKGMYRRPLERLRQHGEPPHPFSSAPHTAALNASGQGKAMGLAELYELRFQDIPVPDEDASGVKRPLPPIDVLSVTTTMEVGIDIGSLTAVAMRNVPPGRANYQQRAGRAGRRGSALSLVATWCGADSHDQEFFNQPAEMVSGEVPDPKLSIHNDKIIQRHLFAELISRFQLDRVPDPDEQDQDSANIFESLGSIDDFRAGDVDEFSFRGLEDWLQQNHVTLQARLEELLPDGFRDDPTERSDYLNEIPETFLEQLRQAGAGPLQVSTEQEPTSSPEDAERAELEAELRSWQTKLAAMGGDPEFAALIGDKIAKLRRRLDELAEASGPDEDEDAKAASGPAESADPDADPDERKLLDRLFAQGVLPRYAFPTSVVALHVFDTARSDRWNAVLEHAPQRDLSQALSGYAPGREVWINGERHYSYAIWSPFFRDRNNAWRQRKLYFYCETCGYAELRDPPLSAPGDTADCPACGKLSGMGPAVWWLRPPGFAHPNWMKKALPSAGETVPTRPTTAKLSASFLMNEAQDTCGGVTVWTDSKELVVTNPGTSERGGRQGFLYCPWCGLAEPNTPGERVALTPTHRIPNPDYRNHDQSCSRKPTVVTLGNQFRTDVAVLRFVPTGAVRLMPETAAFRVVLRTLSVALVRAAASKLDIEPSDIDAEYRVAIGDVDRDRGSVEVFLYDVAAGGAGFVRDAVSLIPSDAEEDGCTSGLEDLLQRALAVLEECPDPHCTSSCYQCLRSYKNKWYHGDLDRLLAAAFLRHCWRGEEPSLSDTVETRLLLALAIELRDAGDEDVDELEVLEEPGHLWLPSLGRAVVISHPLCPDRPATPTGRQAMQARGAANTALVSQLVAERNLPLARQLALGGIAAQEEGSLPPGLIAAVNGIPVFGLEQLGLADPGEPLQQVQIQNTKIGNISPDRYCLVQVSSTVADVHIRPGSWVLVRRNDGASPQSQQDALVILRRDKPFKFTNALWAIGSLTSKAGGKRLQLHYHSRDRHARDETANLLSGQLPLELVLVGEIRGILDPTGTLQPLTLES